jgi:hypothetical protein
MLLAMFVTIHIRLPYKYSGLIFLNWGLSFLPVGDYALEILVSLPPSLPLPLCLILLVPELRKLVCVYYEFLQLGLSGLDIRMWASHLAAISYWESIPRNAGFVTHCHYSIGKGRG